MAKKKKSSHLSTQQKLGIGVGLTAAAVSAAGTYFLYGSKHAKKNRETVKSWVLKAKAEILEKLEDAKEMTKEEYDQLVDTVAGMYATARNISKKDIENFRKEMKQHWHMIEKEAATVKKAVSNASKKTAKKPAKKSSASKSSKTAKKSSGKKSTSKSSSKSAKKGSKKK